jgi:hypothetical protein
MNYVLHILNVRHLDILLKHFENGEGSTVKSKHKILQKF